jgi:hypothetical protein
MKRKIDTALKAAGLPLEIVKGDGYFYFCRLADGGQVGRSVYVCYYKDLPLSRWVKEAKAAFEKGECYD